VVANYFFAGMETQSYGADAEEEGSAGDQQVMTSSIIAERSTDHR
jgi:hypothetical protein